MTACLGISLNPNILKFYSNCEEARLPVVVNEWLYSDGIRFEDSSAVIKDNLNDQMIIFAWTMNEYLMVLPLVWHYIHYSCSVWNCVTSVT